MESIEKIMDVINKLIKLNNDRVAGFEQAGTDLEDNDNRLIPIFRQLANESRQYSAELTGLALQYGNPDNGTTTSGDLHRAWIDIKTSFTCNNLQAVLDECERGEDAIKAAYREALDAGDELNPEVIQLLQRQQQGIENGHNLIKSLRDEVDSKDSQDNDLQPGFPISNGSVSLPETTEFTAQPSYEGAAGEYDQPHANIPEPETIEQEEAWLEEQAGEAGNNKLMEFFINELKDLLWAERELTETMPDMAEAATSEELKRAFEQHLAETKEHVTRLEQIFGILGLEPETRKCDAMAGIVDEGDEIISATEEGTAQRDVGLIFAGQKAEHYEIASYGGMIALAKTLGYYEVAELLVLTLDEEKTADAILTQIAEDHANYAASMEQ